MILIDAGVSPSDPFDRADGDWTAVDAAGTVEHYAVLRCPCYVGLTTLVGAGGWFHGVIAVLEDGRALTDGMSRTSSACRWSPPSRSSRPSPEPPMPASS